MKEDELLACIGGAIKTIRGQINVRIKERLAFDDRMFFLDQFADICPPETALETFLDLTAKGQLTARVQVHSSGGDICFDGELASLNPTSPCSHCEPGIAHKVVPYFVLRRDPAHPEYVYTSPTEALEEILKRTARKELRDIHAIAAEALGAK